jgi:secretory carrier-associated membrane protein
MRLRRDVVKVYRGFFILLLTVTALTYNLVAVIIACLAADVINVASSAVFAIIFFIVGIPGAWITWYGRLYRAMIFDGAVSFGTFFFFFFIHIAFAIWSAISPSLGELKSGIAHAGFFPALDFIKMQSAGNRIAGVPHTEVTLPLCTCPP